MVLHEKLNQNRTRSYTRSGDDWQRRFSVTVPRSKNKLAQLKVYEMKIADPSINSIDELRLVVENRAFGCGVR
jgi:hypothetical protein